jgi:hypothetical protein
MKSCVLPPVLQFNLPGHGGALQLFLIAGVDGEATITSLVREAW